MLFQEDAASMLTVCLIGSLLWKIAAILHSEICAVVQKHLHLIHKNLQFVLFIKMATWYCDCQFGFVRFRAFNPMHLTYLHPVNNKLTCIRIFKDLFTAS